ncbi:DUF4169 family protein [Brevundimonas terrae]|uniref:DUF4169 family protein n=1 Tax=Brevundimonas terrae TaxID=363631 RepID=A0ABN0YES8_9CAUL|nr:DUF4169 family protein [Brevundimonas terrae]NIJ26721.1 hypothetical protein [Brevundimonas terrae]
MAEIINLNRARKQAAKQTDRKQAEANRLTFGRTKLERQQNQKNEAARVSRLEGHKRDSTEKDDGEV